MWKCTDNICNVWVSRSLRVVSSDGTKLYRARILRLLWLSAKPSSIHRLKSAPVESYWAILKELAFITTPSLTALVLGGTLLLRFNASPLLTRLSLSTSNLAGWLSLWFRCHSTCHRVDRYKGLNDNLYWHSLQPLLKQQKRPLVQTVQASYQANCQTKFNLHTHCTRLYTLVYINFKFNYYGARHLLLTFNGVHWPTGLCHYAGY